MGNGSTDYIIEEGLLNEELRRLLRDNGFHVSFAHVRVEGTKRIPMTRISYDISNDYQRKFLGELLPQSKLEVQVN